MPRRFGSDDFPFANWVFLCYLDQVESPPGALHGYIFQSGGMFYHFSKHGTPWKINMELKNGGLEDDFSFQLDFFVLLTRFLKHQVDAISLVVEKTDLHPEHGSPENHPFAKENHLNQTFNYVCCMLIFRGVWAIWISRISMKLLYECYLVILDKTLQNPPHLQ